MVVKRINTAHQLSQDVNGTWQQNAPSNYLNYNNFINFNSMLLKFFIANILNGFFMLIEHFFSFIS